MWDLRTCGTWLAIYVAGEKENAIDLAPVKASVVGEVLLALDLTESTKEVPDLGDGKFPDVLE